MKAVLLTQIGKLEVKEIPTPKPGKDELVIKMLACGICGTDRHILLGEHPAAMPLVLGHEFGGEVTAVGEGVDFEAHGVRHVHQHVDFVLAVAVAGYKPLASKDLSQCFKL